MGLQIFLDRGAGRPEICNLLVKGFAYKFY